MYAKRISVIFLIAALLLTAVLPLRASANSPASAPWYTFELRNAPEGTVYMDLLIDLEETDAHYSQLAEENVPKDFTENAEIITYCEDGFRSYTFHYRGARSKIRLDYNNEVTFFIDSTNVYDEEAYTNAERHQEDIESRGKIRLAMLDAQGNILHVSGTLSIIPSGLFSYSLGYFSYDASADTLDIDSESNLMSVLIFLIIGIGGMVTTCVTEWLVALAFAGIKEYSRQIVITNIVSQLIMRIGQMLLLKLMFVFEIILVYLGMVLILEILVYLGEFLLYRRLIKGVSWKRCLAYTVCANTASLLAGFLLLFIFVF